MKCLCEISIITHTFTVAFSSDVTSIAVNQSKNIIIDIHNNNSPQNLEESPAGNPNTGLLSVKSQISQMSLKPDKFSQIFRVWLKWPQPVFEILFVLV